MVIVPIKNMLFKKSIGIYCTGQWILHELQSSSPVVPLSTTVTVTDSVDHSSMSGVEVISLQGDDDPGTSNLNTSWIGQKGVCAIENSMKVDRLETQIKGLKSELNVLAKQCTKAFMSAGLMNSADQDVRKAVSLCSSHYHVPGTNAKSPPNFATIWNQNTGEKLPVACDRKEHALQVLGSDLVNVITEENREPPDVSYYQLHCVSF